MQDHLLVNILKGLGKFPQISSKPGKLFLKETGNISMRYKERMSIICSVDIFDIKCFKNQNIFWEKYLS